MQNITVVAQTYPQTPRFNNFCRWPTKCPRRPRQGLRLPPICVLWVRFEGTPVRFYYCGPRLVLATRFWTANGGPVFPAHARTARGGAPGTNWPAKSYSASSTLAPQRRGISLFPYISVSRCDEADDTRMAMDTTSVVTRAISSGFGATALFGRKSPIRVSR